MKPSTKYIPHIALIEAPRLPGPEYWDSYMAKKATRNRMMVGGSEAIRNAIHFERSAELLLVTFRIAQGMRCCHAHATGYTGADHGFVGNAQFLLAEESETIAWLMECLCEMRGHAATRESVQAYQEEEAMWAAEEADQYRCATDHNGRP